MWDEALMQRGFRIIGRVQGVYYRAWARGTANELGLRGTARNRSDGSVEVHVIGTAGAVSNFEACLWEGPSAASVTSVEPLEPSEQLPSGPFQILPTV